MWNDTVGAALVFLVGASTNGKFSDNFSCLHDENCNLQCRYSGKNELEHPMGEQGREPLGYPLDLPESLESRLNLLRHWVPSTQVQRPQEVMKVHLRTPAKTRPTTLTNC